MKCRKGMTLAEIITVIIILGGLAAIAAPLIKVATDPEQNQSTYYKNALNMFTSINGQITDEWNFTGDVMTNTSSAFLYCNEVAKRIKTSNSSSSGSAPVGCSASASAITTAPNFVTLNGMRWYGFNNADFASSGSSPKFIKVYVDIDGIKLGANAVDSDILPICVSEVGMVWACSTKARSLLLQ